METVESTVAKAVASVERQRAETFFQERPQDRIRLPRWWRRKWFLVFCVALIMMVSLMIYRVEEKRVEEKRVEGKRVLDLFWAAVKKNPTDLR